VPFYPPYVSIEGYIGCCFISLSGYRYLGDGGTDRREILHDGTHRFRTDLLPYGGGAQMGCTKPKMLGLNFGHLTPNMSKMEVAALHQLELNISSRSAF